MGSQLKIDLEIVNAIALELVFDNKCMLSVSGADRSRVRYSNRAVSSVRGTQEVALPISTCLNRANSCIISKDESPAWARVDAILFRAIDQQCVVRCGAAEPVSHCEIPRIAACPGVAENLLSMHAQNKAEFVIVRVASLAKDSVWNSKEQQLRRSMLQDAYSRLRKNFDGASRAKVEPRFGIRSSRPVDETVPRGIVTRARTYVEKPLPQSEQVGHLE